MWNEFEGNSKQFKSYQAHAFQWIFFLHMGDQNVYQKNHILQFLVELKILRKYYQILKQFRLAIKLETVVFGHRPFMARYFFLNKKVYKDWKHIK